MNRLPSSIPVEANARKGLLTCVTCSIVKRRRWSPPGRWSSRSLGLTTGLAPTNTAVGDPKRLTRSSWKMDAGIISDSGRHPHDALCSGTSCPTGVWLDRRVSHGCQGQTTMLVTPENNRRNRNHAFAIAGATAVARRGCGLVLASCASLSGPLSIHLLVGSAAMPPAVEDYETAVSRFVGTDTSIPRRLLPSAVRP